MHFISFDAPLGPDDRAVGREPPPGRDVAEDLQQSLTAAGFRIVEPLAQHDSYGWSFTVATGNSRPVACILQLSDEWLLITHPQTPMLKRLFGGRDSSREHTDVDAALLKALSAIPKVSDVRWFASEADLRAGRAGQP